MVGGWEIKQRGVPLVYECCKMVVGTSCGLGVGGWGLKGQDPFSV